MGSKILLVDDELAISAALMVRLQSLGHDVASASSGLGALEAVSLERPDVILLDIRMPDIDGYEVCRRLKQDAALASIPVIFVSANVLEPARKAAFEVGGAAFVPKPFEVRDVLAAIESATSTQTGVPRSA